MGINQDESRDIPEQRLLLHHLLNLDLGVNFIHSAEALQKNCPKDRNIMETTAVVPQDGEMMSKELHSLVFVLIVELLTTHFNVILDVSRPVYH